MTDDSSLLVGGRLKAVRNERGLTLRNLAAASGLSINTISLIERGKISPTVATLHKLGTALGVSVSFFVEETSPKEVVFQKGDQRPQARSTRVSMEDLGSGLAEQTMEPLLLTLEPGAESHPEPIVHLGHEFVFCLEGCIEYQIKGRSYLLEPSDSLLFEGHLPHRWRNARQASSRALLILQAPEGHSEAAQRHF